tara:strand:+ start:145 stop:339 length:195 start_codon:yes stop_codon:yes gene_type:complete
MKLKIELEECFTCNGGGSEEYFISETYNYGWQDCSKCGGVGQIAYAKINDKKCKLNLEVMENET